MIALHVRKKVLDNIQFKLALHVQVSPFNSWWWDEKGKSHRKRVDKTDDVSSSSDIDKISSIETTIAPVLELQGAPRQPTVLALPLDRRPLFPGHLHPIQIG